MQPSRNSFINRMENWGRCMRDSGASPSHCGSIEGKFVSEKLHTDDKTASRTPTRTNDILDAQCVERAVHAVPVKLHRWVLVSKFVKAYSSEKICRVLKLRWELYEVALDLSFCSAELQLALVDRREKASRVFAPTALFVLQRAQITDPPSPRAHE